MVAAPVPSVSASGVPANVMLDRFRPALTDAVSPARLTVTAFDSADRLTVSPPPVPVSESDASLLSAFNALRPATTLAAVSPAENAARATAPCNAGAADPGAPVTSGL